MNQEPRDGSGSDHSRAGRKVAGRLAVEPRRGALNASLRKMVDNLAATIFAGLCAGAVAVALVPAAASAQSAALPPVASKADPAKGEKIASQVCAACHGPDGNSTAPVNPKIAAQHPVYLQKQLADFKVKEGAKAADRPSPIMSAFAAPLSEQDMLDLSAFFSAKPLKPSAAKEKDLVDLGRNIYRGGIVDKGVPSCAGCHGPTGAGIPGQYPRLGGQFSDYTEAQLVAFRSGARHNNVSMAVIASRLSDREIKALADYVAGLR
jgi:cytochrome c553